ncbi:Cytochrome c [Pirellula sp. SH-Sr6A]|uniref:DUF6797 domain-containing protein n=1 Tax=Pirellula sp. SH-Sr6A TaxID=1632865 RepID=UPI00078B7ABA|nr:DUF6797 domain-containing protein [Pirellula sp. SH-Sr6A]AMV31438.1 Cytochrome c [Pirellula sp. SH-Sr6A]
MIVRLRFLGCLLLVLAGAHSLLAQTLESELQAVPVTELIEKSKQLGDAARGAILFFQPQMACQQCHEPVSSEGARLGPDLTSLGRDVTDEALLESVLWPSKVIRKGFETVSVRTVDEEIFDALIIASNDHDITLQELAKRGSVRKLERDDVEEMKIRSTSIMPSGQISALASRQQFYDLIRYLMEIRDGGAGRAAELRPSQSSLTVSIPDYERDLDHRALILGWDDDAFLRGEKIYQRVCANCHGTLEQPGSLPTSLRFAEGPFKNGSDPYSMYRTLTYGYGMMMAQTWMVPSQKYDVIHYIRQHYLRQHNPTQWTAVDGAYLSTLPEGSSKGPAPSKIEPWSSMDYGASLAHTFEIPSPQKNFAYKGVAVRLDAGAGGIARGQHWMVFDTDTLRMAASWSRPLSLNDASQSVDSAFIDWRGIQFNGEHGIHPSLVGRVGFANPQAPGWANPANGSFEDRVRVEGRDGKRYGSLPRSWGQYRGLYQHGQRIVFSYSIGSTDVLESPWVAPPSSLASHPYSVRLFHIGPRDHDMELQVAEHATSEVELEVMQIEGATIALLGQDRTAKSEEPILATIWPPTPQAAWHRRGRNLTLKISSGREPINFALWQPLDTGTKPDTLAVAASSNTLSPEDVDLQRLTRGGPARWGQAFKTPIQTVSDTGPFAVDHLVAPESNPWLAQMRFTGLDFFSDGGLALCTWDGDVWKVQRSSDSESEAWSWRRIATGMFQPLGLKIISDRIYITCRDQLAVLHDLNGDAEIDFYECLNNDHQVTEHFHEFAMGLQVDGEGNFYYAKSGCHGKAAVVPHHGTLLRVERDGSKTTILANGFRAANGVCLNPDGSFFVTDQEGFWNPKNRINWVTLSETSKPKFYGNMLGYHDITDPSDSAMEPPLCWITNTFDRSPAELLWVDSPSWGKLNGRLLNLSYGYGKVFLVPHEQVGEKMQGGMIELPIPPFPTGVMRGRFHPKDGHLYLCGMFAWAGNATAPGGLYRIRATDQPVHLPVELHAFRRGVQLRFAEPLDETSVHPEVFSVKTWSLERTAKYGSKHLDEKTLQVTAAKLSADGTVVDLEIDGLKPTWGMEIQYSLKALRGELVNGRLHNTIHTLRD